MDLGRTTTMKENITVSTEQLASERGPNSKRIHGSSIRTGAFFGGLLAAVGFMVYTTFADPAPVLTITPLGSNQFSIAITNASTPTNYMLEWTPAFANTNYPWLAVATNAPGQTNFVMDMGPWPMGFLRVSVGWDGDGDLVPAWMDAQPQNSAVGALTVTIDSPLNGSSIQ